MICTILIKPEETGIKEVDDKLKVFTTRPDTIYGVSFMVIAPEHPIIEKYEHLIKNIDAVIDDVSA